MYEYVHGGDIYSALRKNGGEKILDFSVNVNPLGLPEAVKKAVWEVLDQCGRYPDPFCRELTAALAVHEKTREAFIYCGNGASDLIFRLAQALKPRRALLLAPTFADYEKALLSVDCRIDYYNLREEDGFRVGVDFLGQIHPGLDLIWLCNPNNPVGETCRADFLQEVLACCREKDIILAVDECFLDFVEEAERNSLQPFIESHNNLIILKAFTKTYALPGLRLGYILTSNAGIIEKMRMVGQDWSVSLPAQAAGICALRQEEYLLRAKSLLRKEKEFLKTELRSLGFKIYGSKANFIFFRSSILDLAQKLLSYHILIRSCANYRNLGPEFFRIAVKKPEENRALVAALRDIVGAEGQKEVSPWPNQL